MPRIFLPGCSDTFRGSGSLKRLRMHAVFGEALATFPLAAGKQGGTAAES
ncbi:MAG: hypothetical protein H0T51_00105 [Pirellulales bacterium]|nr:hypothetical protein [Pirellulales bacterium]